MQHQLADVVQQARDDQAVALLVADLAREQSAARCVARACRRKRSGAAPRRSRARRSRMCARGRRAPARSAGRAARRRRRRLDAPPRVRDAVGERAARRSTSATSDSTAATTSAVATWSSADEREQPVARLGERRERLERLERRRQAAAVALVCGARRRRAGLPGALLGGRRLSTARGWRLRRCCACCSAISVVVLVRSPSVGGRRSCRAIGSRRQPVERGQAWRRQRRGAQADERRVDPRERLLATEQRDALEDARRDRACRRARRAAAGRPRAAWRRGARRPRSSACSIVVLVEAGRAAASAVARLARAPRARPRPASARARPRVVGGPSKRKPASGQKSASVWIFSWLIAAAAREPGRAPV